MKLLKISKKLIPSKLKILLLKIYFLKISLLIKRDIKRSKKNHYKALLNVKKKLNEKEKIKIAFFLINVDSWKLDSVYWAFLNDNIFNPIVIVCPFVNKGQDFLENELKKSIQYCKLKNYNFFIAYNQSEFKTIDIKDNFKPDIVFFTNPNSLTSKEFLIDNYLDVLTCYVPYSFRIDNLFEYDYNNRLVNLVWLNFYESNIHKNLANNFALNKGNNVIVTGFPFLDSYKTNDVGKNVWKNIEKQRIKIIWAPHWTISGFQDTGLDWSCFLDYFDLILEIAQKLENEIQFAMKPHPFLKNILEQDNLWGVEKTEQYFKKWQEFENCQVVNGDYTKLFLQSDALIHDSGSFMVEYLALNKPMAYTVSQKSIKNRFNEFGQIVLSGHSLIYSESDFLNFIENLIKGFDPLIEKRAELISEQNFEKNILASQEIVKQLKLKIV